MAVRGRSWLGTAVRLALGGVFLWAGAAKVTDLAGSVRAVNAYRLLPYELAQVAGAVLPFVELTVGFLLVAGLATRVAAGLSAVLLAAFTAGIVAAWARGLSIDCGCFGGGELAAGQSPQYGGELARDTVLLAAAAALAIWPRTPISIDGWLARDNEENGP